MHWGGWRFSGRTEPRAHAAAAFAWPVSPDCSCGWSLPSRTGCGPPHRTAAYGHRPPSSPFEGRFNPFPGPLTDPVALMMSSASINGRALLLRHLGRYLQLLTSLDEAPGFVAPVGAHSDAPLARRRCQHLQRSFTLPGPIGCRLVHCFQLLGIETGRQSSAA